MVHAHLLMCPGASSREKTQEGWEAKREHQFLKAFRNRAKVWPSPYKQQGRERSLCCARSLLSGCRVGKGSWWGGRCGLEGSGGLVRERVVKWEEGKRVQEYPGVGTNRYGWGVVPQGETDIWETFRKEGLCEGGDWGAGIDAKGSQALWEKQLR